MRPPRELSDLAYASYLEPHEGGLSPDGRYTEVHFDAAEFDGFDAGHSRVGECAFTGVSFGNGSFAGSRFSDVWFSRTRWVGVDAAGTEWLDSTVVSSFLAGVEAYAGALRRVTFEECKINTLNLRGSTLQNVVFDRCELIELDLGGAALTDVSFPGSALRRVRLAGATLNRVDVRGATELDLADGWDCLRGAIVDSSQLIELAPMLAAALGVVVRDAP